MRKPSKTKFRGNLLVVLLGAFMMLLVSSANGPDLNLHFLREIPSEIPADWIDRNVSAISRWPSWFYSLDKVEYDNRNQKELAPDSILTLYMNPHKGGYKKFTLKVKVMEYIPRQVLRLRVLEDSSQRLTRLFDLIEWKVSLNSLLGNQLSEGSGKNKTTIRGEETAHTAHWRSRLFGRFTDRILMNQIFYPDLMKLSQLKQPFSLTTEEEAQNANRSY